MTDNPNDIALEHLAEQLQQWGRELGFQQVGITDVDLTSHEPKLKEWLAKGYNGSMAWMGEHGNMRSRPDELLPGTIRVISARMDYLPADTEQIKVLKDGEKAYISRYSLGRDYHKLIRKRLSQLAKQLEAEATKLFPDLAVEQRAFVDSAPVMERPLAEKAGLGWAGKHTLIINENAGSWFFLGEILTNIPLPVNPTIPENKCGSCTACLKVCPTDAFPEPYTVDAKRCISYLTIENKGPIPVEFREPIGNRVFGCDDCQAICPWNKFAQFSQETDFSPRHNLDNSRLVDLFQWSEAEFLKNTEGSPLRRAGYNNWLRNLAVGLGNAPLSHEIIDALTQKREHASEMVQEHIDWALAQQAQPNRRRKRKIKTSDTTAIEVR
jgi:epoxyqueuosine reductase